MNMMYRHMNQPMDPLMNPPMHSMQPEQVVVVEPYVFAAVSTLIGKPVVLETSRGRVSGMVMDAKPDHLVLQQGDSAFFVRLCEVVWIMPETV